VSVTVALSVPGVTVRAAAVAGLAMVALLLTGWRKPARAEPHSPRGDATGIVVDHLDAPPYRRPGIARRLLAMLASSGLAVLIGVMMAIVLAFAVAIAVIWMTDLLG
jgi:ribosomal protein S18 acetylase RimI-like enzyme